MDKLREYQYREGYGRSLEGKRVEWDVLFVLWSLFVFIEEMMETVFVGEGGSVGGECLCGFESLCVVKNGVNERTDVSVFFWLGHFERVENSRTSSWVSEETVYKKSYWTGLKVWMRMMRERNDRRGSL